MFLKNPVQAIRGHNLAVLPPLYCAYLEGHLTTFGMPTFASMAHFVEDPSKKVVRLAPEVSTPQVEPNFDQELKQRVIEGFLRIKSEDLPKQIRALKNLFSGLPRKTVLAKEDFEELKGAIEQVFRETSLLDGFEDYLAFVLQDFEESVSKSSKLVAKRNAAQRQKKVKLKKYVLEYIFCVRALYFALCWSEDPWSAVKVKAHFLEDFIQVCLWTQEGKPSRVLALFAHLERYLRWLKKEGKLQCDVSGLEQVKANLPPASANRIRIHYMAEKKYERAKCWLLEQIEQAKRRGNLLAVEQWTQRLNSLILLYRTGMRLEVLYDLKVNQVTQFSVCGEFPLEQVEIVLVGLALKSECASRRIVLTGLLTDDEPAIVRRWLGQYESMSKAQMSGCYFLEGSSGQLSHRSGSFQSVIDYIRREFGLAEFSAHSLRHSAANNMMICSELSKMAEGAYRYFLPENMRHETFEKGRCEKVVESVMGLGFGVSRVKVRQFPTSLMRVLGHLQFKTTLKTYLHVMNLLTTMRINYSRNIILAREIWQEATGYKKTEANERLKTGCIQENLIHHSMPSFACSLPLARL